MKSVINYKPFIIYMIEGFYDKKAILKVPNGELEVVNSYKIINWFRKMFYRWGFTKCLIFKYKVKVRE